ncbi:YhhN-like protein [Bombardia bombarda]|uniref:YhhN-like protein n=1 Tax=Bombardia bombarda TaxID=252184 RepID=A0AA39WGX7_9PEZI|nr:YhhN-like protein [Bombardia bombarda]
MSTAANTNISLNALLTPSSIILALSLTTSLLYGLLLVHVPPSPTRTFNKTASTALLALLAHLHSTNQPLLPAALALGSAGDFFLALPESTFKGDDTAFLAGLSSFLAAHLLYVKIFYAAGTLSPDHVFADLLNSLSSWRILLAGFLTLGFAPIMLAQLVPRVERGLRAPIIVYTTAIVTMVLAALTIKDNGRALVGAVLFMASDAILAADRFLVAPASHHQGWMPYAVWGLYYSGQLLITLGLIY